MGMDGVRPGFFGEPGKFDAGASAPQDQRGTERGEMFAKRCQTVVQPPALRRAEALSAWGLVIENVNRKDGPAFRCSREGRMIVKAQVLSEPNQLRCH